MVELFPIPLIMSYLLFRIPKVEKESYRIQIHKGAYFSINN